MAEEQTFIPKTTAATKLLYQGRGLGWLTGAALIFFVASLLLSFGLFFYKDYLEADKKTLADELKKSESYFEPSLMLELQRTAKSISSTGDLLDKHTALSRLLDFLAQNTMADARFSNFSYDKNEVQILGVVKSYTALAQQSLIFEKSRLIKNVSFSNFSLTSEGFVNFSVKFGVEPELISYQAPSTAGQAPSN
ncbi:MAG: hypothetical protein AAB527_01640 [Patescibacteria group bacterium]